MKKIFLMLLFVLMVVLCACSTECDHTYTLANINEATCDSQGNKTYTCSQCNDSYEESISATGHTWENATCTSPKTCKTCNATEGSALGHNWKNATCTSPQKCKTCNATEGSALGHNWKNATCTSPKKCKTCSATEGSALGHTWENATCTSPKTCKTCHATEGSALGHTWENATCTSPKTCKTCHATEGSAAGHDWKNATCTSPKTCKTCHATEGSAAGHKFKTTGFCANCDQTIVSLKVQIPKPNAMNSEVSIVYTNNTDLPIELDMGFIHIYPPVGDSFLWQNHYNIFNDITIGAHETLTVSYNEIYSWEPQKQYISSSCEFHVFLYWNGHDYRFELSASEILAVIGPKQ